MRTLLITMFLLLPATSQANGLYDAIVQSCAEYAVSGRQAINCVPIQYGAAKSLLPYMNKPVLRTVIRKCTQSQPFEQDWLYIHACFNSQLHKALYGR